ncbi:hypothetical protein [Pectobacterium brasiliense]|uniref:hypothetical protein n=1 Tax=Pectobacterium brasiliense TaxID=180957 RepID=UPI001F07A68A|nr:hypothetical protein [Pectobacterium brasiliense]
MAGYSGPSIVYLVNPNNPTGTITPADFIEPWIASKPATSMRLMPSSSMTSAFAQFH